MSDTFHSSLYYFCLRQGLSQNLKLVISQGGRPAHQSYLSLPQQQQDSVLTNASEFSHDLRLQVVMCAYIARILLEDSSPRSQLPYR